MVDGSGLRTRNREPGTENQELGTYFTIETPLGSRFKVQGSGLRECGAAVGGRRSAVGQNGGAGSGPPSPCGLPPSPRLWRDETARLGPEKRPKRIRGKDLG